MKRSKKEKESEEEPESEEEGESCCKASKSLIGRRNKIIAELSE